MDGEPRTLEPQQQAALQALSRQVSALLELRRTSRAAPATAGARLVRRTAGEVQRCAGTGQRRPQRTGPARPADRPGQPARTGRGAGAGVGGGSTGLPGAARHRPLQGDQRHPWPSGGRQRAGEGRRDAARDQCRAWPAGAAWRRGVRLVVTGGGPGAGDAAVRVRARGGGLRLAGAACHHQIGVSAHWPGHTVGEWLQRADAALYAA